MVIVGRIILVMSVISVWVGVIWGLYEICVEGVCDGKD